MEPRPKKEFYNIGQILLSKKGKAYITLGSLNNANAQYNRHIEIVVRDRPKSDPKSQVLYSAENGQVFIADPRATAKNPEKIPSFVLNSLSVSKESEE